jgi:hypothetical protein
VRFATITLYVTAQRVFTVVSVYFVIGSVRKLLDTPSYAALVRDTAAVSYLQVKYKSGCVNGLGRCKCNLKCRGERREMK